MKTIILLTITVLAEVHAQFSAAGQQQILDVHNAMRSKIAKGTYVAKGTTKPAGANFRKLKWDASVAQSAQNYANTCPNGHSYPKGLGENMYFAWAMTSNEELNKHGAAASRAWEKEFQDFGWTTNTYDTSIRKIGHATQSAWADTGSIGCGVKNCKDGAFYQVVVVCQYKTQGNYIGQPVYKTGATCSACPSGTKCETATGLCV